MVQLEHMDERYSANMSYAPETRTLNYGFGFGAQVVLSCAYFHVPVLIAIADGPFRDIERCQTLTQKHTTNRTCRQPYKYKYFAKTLNVKDLMERAKLTHISGLIPDLMKFKLVDPKVREDEDLDP